MAISYSDFDVRSNVSTFFDKIWLILKLPRWYKKAETFEILQKQYLSFYIKKI
jgi:hypothetical protein